MDLIKINKIMNDLLRKIVDEHPDIPTLLGLHQAISLEIIKPIKWKAMLTQSTEAMDYNGAQPAPTEREILEDLERSFKAAIGDSLPEEEPC